MKGAFLQNVTRGKGIMIDEDDDTEPHVTSFSIGLRALNGEALDKFCKLVKKVYLPPFSGKYRSW